MHSKEDSDPDNKYVYRDNTYVSEEDCKNCLHHHGFKYDGFVVCRRHENLSVLVHHLPAQYLKNFINGEMIVMCQRER